MKTKMITRVFEDEMKSTLKNIKDNITTQISNYESVAYKVEINIPEKDDKEQFASLKFYCVTTSNVEYTVELQLDPRLLGNLIK